MYIYEALTAYFANISPDMVSALQILLDTTKNIPVDRLNKHDLSVYNLILAIVESTKKEV